MSKKELNVYYKGSKQKIKYYDSINEEQIKKTVKQIFKINEPLEQIFFQDEDGDILILNDHIPSGLSIYIFVEPDSIPKNPSKELKVENKPDLVKFHWVLEKETENADILSDVIENKYIYMTIDGSIDHPFARSSCTFEKGVHFFVLRTGRLGPYTLLCICEENKNTREEIYQYPIGIVDGNPHDWSDDIYTINLGILIDMEKKKCAFYDYDKKIKRKIQYKKNLKEQYPYEEVYEAPINFKKAKVVAWIKRNGCSGSETGITILNEGCIPIPDWVK